MMQENQHPRCLAHSREQFPVKLYAMLELAEVRGFGCSGCSWLAHGRAFRIDDERVFMEAAVPIFFKQTKIRSFYRQLNLWGFKRVYKGVDAGAWYNAHFKRGSPGEIKRISRAKTKASKDGDPRCSNRSSGCREDPDFYSMPPLPGASRPAAAAAGCPMPVDGGRVATGPRRFSMESIDPALLAKSGLMLGKSAVPRRVSSPSLGTRETPVSWLMTPSQCIRDAASVPIQSINSLVQGVQDRQQKSQGLRMSDSDRVAMLNYIWQRRNLRAREAAMVASAPTAPSPPSYASNPPSSRRILGAKDVRALIAGGLLEPLPFARAASRDVAAPAARRPSPELRVCDNAVAMESVWQRHDAKARRVVISHLSALASPSSSSPSFGREEVKALIAEGIEPLPFDEFDCRDTSLAGERDKGSRMEPPPVDDETPRDEFASYIDNVIQILR